MHVSLLLQKSLKVIELSYIRGKNDKSMVKRLMAKKKGKQKFSNLATCSVKFDTIKTQGNFKHSTQNKIENIIKYLLAQAPFNLKRQIEKKLTFIFYHPSFI
ncbi:Hypothetical protein CINCED_3A025768 [Cinara cedri]|uniref:Uncharacterized protein n=1 Tax=Cinara cedri TaxID=506608 RepID=A0A5E4NBD8_9HEMI|nr:Hypothetical protein CINCED_3A025768 [Cinara cedri]